MVTSDLVTSWDAMMGRYQPGRADMLRTAAATAEAALGDAPATVLDLGGGPGTTARDLLDMWPAAQVTVADLDPVLLALAAATLPPSATVRSVDLRTPDWNTTLGGPYDLVLVVMTLHYLPGDRVRDVYADIASLLRPRGLLLHADVLDDVSDTIDTVDDGTWTRWWDRALAEPALADAATARATALHDVTSAEFTASTAWHRAALTAAGYREVSVPWRRGRHGLLAATR
ncbi:class I SAM-dependent methyltransferase [Micromonospora andamanensis]|uniref:Methyltransferase domain-containing protein n=1 Tax=Micromonospora andamanensis TaxID=1287068 RepID=A0ABQ4I215_9ACTN|nr:class I SAM-dependent methyltransferase [Micromonospora andamanensis]GIJ11915.1 hypothetical protein Van01_51290 [Micromonospora andamanensis]GIJ42974.1 hypothetical protein Vwe01_62990 [Micromonospora andamanensis]